MPFVWLILIVAFVLIEAFTYQLLCIWFAIGSIAGLITSLITDNYMLQISVFVIVSAIMLICLRPAVKKGLKPRGLKTSTEELIGREVIITEDVCNLKSSGQGKVNGMTWTVRSSDNTNIKQGSTAVVEKVEGVKLIVKEREK